MAPVTNQETMSEQLGELLSRSDRVALTVTISSTSQVRNCSPLTVCYMQIGTACVTRGKDSRLALGRLGGLVEQLETLVRSGKQVILVTSGTPTAGHEIKSDT